MLFEIHPLGQLGTNCYLLSGDNAHAIIVDPAEDGAYLKKCLDEKGLTLDAICLTHVHYDHIGGLTVLSTLTGAPVYLHPDDLSIAETMSCGLLNVATHPYPETLHAGGLAVSVFHTPGHSPGSVCLMAEDKLLSGDTLFACSCGRTDFVGGDWEKMKQSLRFLSGLPGNPHVYPGHGESTTLAAERNYNPYLKEAVK